MAGSVLFLLSGFASFHLFLYFMSCSSFLLSLFSIPPFLFEYFDYINYKIPAAFFSSFLVGINLCVCPSISFQSSLIAI